MIKKIKRVIQLLKSDHGRKYGWYIYLNREIVGELINPQFSDMFWDRYDINPISDEKIDIIQNENLWNQCAFTFKNIVLNENVASAIFSDTQSIKDGKILARSLYLKPESKMEKIIFSILRPFIK